LKQKCISIYELKLKQFSKELNVIPKGLVLKNLKNRWISLTKKERLFSINLVDSESTQGRIANEEQIRNIFNAALQDKSNNLPIINGIIDNLLNLGLIEPSND